MNKKNKKCPKCNSIRTKGEEGTNDFLHFKGQGETAQKAKLKKEQGYFCWDCEHKWSEKLI